MKAADSKPFLIEYSSDDAIRRYTKSTAGVGIDYLLQNAYGPIYLKAATQYMSAPKGDGINLLEFGCGAGMNLIYSLSLFEGEKIPVRAAYGTDFSERLIEAANDEAGLRLTPDGRRNVRFLKARNECLVADMTQALVVNPGELQGSFHLIFGVNTFRYCHRLGKAVECAQDISALLSPGGVCVMIDMNNKFPLFRTAHRDRLTKPIEERYLPTLAEYARPFAQVGLEILEHRNFCWIPHSASPIMLGLCRLLTPFMDALAPTYAMRSLVIARKPIAR